MFKTIYDNNKPTQYIICDDGVIYNTKTHRNLKGSISNGYVYVQLTIDDVPRSFALHRLLAEYFLDNPQNKAVVHHIDGNPLNNNLSNLAWVTQQENSNLKCYVSPKVENTIPVFSSEELAKEVWVPFKDTTYEVSNLGRFKNMKTNFITTGSQNKNNGYIRWTFGVGSKRVEIQAHRAVYQAFHPEENIEIINHIDGNRANNRLSNLENISASENTKKAYYETKRHKTIYVAQYDLQGNLLEVYPSIAEAARTIGAANTSVVRNAMLDKRTCKGFMFKEIDKDFFLAHKLNNDVSL